MFSNLFRDGLLWRAASSSIEPTGRTASLGIAAIDRRLPEHGLRLGAVHEWCLEQELSSHKRAFWSAPLSLLSALIAHNLRLNTLTPGGVVAWVGRRCWPTPSLLAEVFAENGLPDWRSRCLFLRPNGAEQYLWAACELLRSPCIAAAVIDASSIEGVAARRLQLYARRSSVLGLLIKPPWKISSVSAAHTKWKVAAAPSPSKHPRWQLELLRCRGTPPASSWTIEYRLTKQPTPARCENFYLHLPAELVDRPAKTQIRAA